MAGTSMATPCVAGVASQIRQYFEQFNSSMSELCTFSEADGKKIVSSECVSGTNLRGATVKALLIHSGEPMAAYNNNNGGGDDSTTEPTTMLASPPDWFQVNRHMLLKLFTHSTSLYTLGLWTCLSAECSPLHRHRGGPEGACGGGKHQLAGDIYCDRYHHRYLTTIQSLSGVYGPGI
jgi:hypothetical protein